jgi:hypothetical protein
MMAVGIMISVFIAASILDVILAVINSRFYSTAAFITIFGVGGVFAGGIAFMSGMDSTVEKTEGRRWQLIAVIVLTALLFVFVLAKIEGGEYAMAFRAFGITSALTMLLFVKGKL